MSCKEKRILMNKFVESQFEVLLVYEFQTKAHSYQHISWASVWSHVILWVSNKSDFWWRYLLSLSLKLFKFLCFNQNLILMKTFVESQFEVMYVYEFQTKANSDEDICWVSIWNYVSVWVSNKNQLLWRQLWSFSLKLRKFMSFKPSQILINTFFEPQFEVM